MTDEEFISQFAVTVVRSTSVASSDGAPVRFSIVDVQEKGGEGEAWHTMRRFEIYGENPVQDESVQVYLESLLKNYKLTHGEEFEEVKSETAMLPPPEGEAPLPTPRRQLSPAPSLPLTVVELDFWSRVFLAHYDQRTQGTTSISQFQECCDLADRAAGEFRSRSIPKISEQTVPHLEQLNP